MANNDQAKRFEDTAREIGCDESGEAFERAFGKIVPPKTPDRTRDDAKRPPDTLPLRDGKKH